MHTPRVHSPQKVLDHLDALVQERRNSIANAPDCRLYSNILQIKLPYKT